MSTTAELDAKIDALRDRLIEDARTPISMGNGRAKLRTAQEIALGLLNIADELNQMMDAKENK